MLVLTRKSGEKLRIGSNIIVTVLDILPSQIKLGIEAPHDIPVHREEVYVRIQEENKGAVIRGGMWSTVLKHFKLESD